MGKQGWGTIHDYRTCTHAIKMKADREKALEAYINTLPSSQKGTKGGK
jgi:hypothetical protein